MDLNDLSMEFFGARRSEETARTRTMTTVLAKAVSDSEDGRVRLEVDGTTTTAEDPEGNQDGTSVVEVPTSPAVKDGDSVIVTTFGGKEKTPVVTGVIGSGDRIKTAAENAERMATESSEAIAQVRQDIADFKEEAEATYATTEYVDDETGALSRSIATTYLSKSDANTTYATKSELTQESEAITAAVAADYVSKSDAETTYATKSELTVAEGRITSTVAETYSTKTETATAKSEAISAAATDATSKANAAQSAAISAAATDATTKANAAQSAAISAANSYTDDAVDGLASDADLTALTTRVSTAETNITQNTTAITAKANSSDVYTKAQTDGLISTEVTNRNAAITAASDAITAAVSETYSTKSETAAVANVADTANGKADTLNESVSTLTLRADGITASVKSMQQDYGGTVQSVNSYMKFGTDGLEVGKEGSPMKSYFNESSLSFKANGQEVMKLDGVSSTVSADRWKVGGWLFYKAGGGKTLVLDYFG